MQNSQDVQLAATTLKSNLPADFLAAVKRPVGIILGTGLSSIPLARDFKSIPFSAIPGFPLSYVESHAGRFAAGCMADLPVIIQQGRCHLYEGRSPAEICMGVRLMWSIGCQTLVITNAAGALNPLFEAGSLMCIADMINHTGVSPLTGPNCDSWGPRFPDMSCPFANNLQKLALDIALREKIRLNHGVYIGVHGPEMETPAETRMYRQWGADAIGMSTVLEVIAARQLGMAVLGISCLTNKNLPDCMAPAPLEQVLAVAREAGPQLAKLLEKILEYLANNPKISG